MEQLKELLAACTYIPFYDEKSNFVIAKFKALDSGMNFTAKGNFFVEVGKQYFVSGFEDKQDKYKSTYRATNIKPDIDLSKATNSHLTAYLSTVTSNAIAKRLVEEIPNIIEVIEAENIEVLSSVKGVGDTVAWKIIELHGKQIDYSEAIIGLAKFGFTKKAIIDIVAYFKSAARAVEEVNKNPYVLASMTGYGFKKCDALFLIANQDNPKAASDPRRVQAYVDFLFEEEGQNGNTWLSPKEFMEKVTIFIPEADIKEAIKYINTSKKYLTFEAYNQKRIASKRYMDMELEVASRLLAMVQSKPIKEIVDADKTIYHVETNQGFKFDPSQRQAIDDMLNKNVFLLQGVAGSGKTSTISGVSRVLRDNDYTIAQCALSGKAADNLAQVTGQDGKTIHSLIGYGSQKPHNEENPLPHDVIIIDEISMVNIEIFLALLKAMKSGAKLIMLGDSGQLDSIGVGIMQGIMNSGTVPDTTLTTIHRQAKDSAIITHSIAFRSGVKHSELVVKSPTDKVYGVNKDLEYILTKNNDEANIYKYAMIRFKDSIEKYGIDGTQILCAAKTAGTTSVNNLNYYAQILANPKASNKPEFPIKNNDYDYVLREGDKVINTKNNYNTISVDGAETPIFNGNTGTILRLEGDGIGLAVIRFDGVGDVNVPLKTADSSIQLGYAITIHKSQGSTIPSVIVALPFHFMLNSRELLYTAITRASKRATLITSPKTFQSTLRKSSKRTQQTNLSVYLQDYNLYADKLTKKLKGA